MRMRCGDGIAGGHGWVVVLRSWFSCYPRVVDSSEWWARVVVVVVVVVVTKCVCGSGSRD